MNSTFFKLFKKRGFFLTLALDPTIKNLSISCHLKEKFSKNLLEKFYSQLSGNLRPFS